MRKFFFVLAILFQWFLVAGCGPEAEVGYSPPGIPIRISIDTNGKIGIDLSYEWQTPIGTFDLSGGTTIHDLRNQSTGRLLIVRVDDKATVYELVEGREFKVNFNDENKLYKKVALTYETDGDIVLELESVQITTSPLNTSVNSPNDNSSGNNSSCPGAISQKVAVGSTVLVCTKSDNLIIRKKPSPNSSELFRIAPGTSAVIVGGPTCADNSSWWKIEVPAGIYVRRGSYDAPEYTLDSNTIGWVREGSDPTDPYYICAN